MVAAAADPRPPSPAGLTLARAAATVLVLLGLLVLLGWLLEADILRRVVLAGPRMTPYTAIAFVLVGGAVLAGGRLRAACLAAVLAWALVTGGEWLLGGLGGFDRWLIPGAPDSPEAGRAAQTTVVAFGALSLAALLGDRAPRLRVALLTSAGAVAYGALIGHLVGDQDFYGKAGTSGTAIHTAVGLLVAVVALAALRPEAVPARWVLSRTFSGFVAASGLAVAAVGPVVLTGGAVLLGNLGLDQTDALAISSVLSAGLFGAAALVGARRASALEARAGAALAGLRRSEEQRDRMFADVSHELRSPLTVIMAELDLLARGPLADRPGELDVLRGEAAEMRRRVDDLLALAALQAGPQSLELSRGDLSVAAHSAVARLEQVAAERGVTVQLDAPAEIESAFDRLRLHGALSNLVENAIKHGREGGRVQVRVRRVEDRRAELVVEDDGPGVPEAEREQVFERFARGEGATPGSGSGVGLAIVREVVEAHGGTITLSAAPEGGARFTVQLPCERATAAGAPSPRGDRHAPVVLLIDDQPAVLSTLTALLQGRYAVLGAATAGEAVRVLRESRPEVVVTDQIAPGPGHASIVDELLAASAEAPLVVMTGDMAGADRAESRPEVRAVLRKPFAAEELEATLARVLG